MADDSQGLELVVKTRDVLASFDGRLASTASAAARDECVFWSGSGLSASVVPGVSELTIKSLSFLHERSEPSEESGRFGKA